MREEITTETEQRLGRPLIQLAKLVGVATSYIGQSSDYHEIDDDVLVEVLAALGVDASGDEAIARSTRAILDQRNARLVPPTVLCTAGRDSEITVNTPILDVPKAEITLEDGSAFTGSVRLEPSKQAKIHLVGSQFVSTATLVIPGDLPVGYHVLHLHLTDSTQDATLICAPEQVPMLGQMQRGRLWGWMAQLYSIRSSGSWGVGDFVDLKNLLTQAKRKTDADFILINPVHAGEPVSPLTPSPYLPVSRQFVNFTYIRPENIEEYQSLDESQRQEIRKLHDQTEPLNGDAQVIDRDVMWKAKMRALWLIFKVRRSVRRQVAFDVFKRERGRSLDAYAVWCLCYDKWGKPSDDPNNWQQCFNVDAADVRSLCGHFPDTLDFYRWLEWVASDQLDEAQMAAKEAGMAIGIMSDMAVGVHQHGADVWSNPDWFARKVTAGAPPDYFNQQGQNWNQPPLDPIQLANTGYQAYRTLIHGMFEHAGAVRIDHILGLFRLWWIPRGQQPTDGTYVQYDHEVLLGILAIEALRSHGVVIGEDLGVVPDYVVKVLKRHQVLGCDVEWFEQKDGEFIKPKRWRRCALASVNTHDLPPAAGYLAYEQVAIRKELGLLNTSVEEFQAAAVKEHQAMLAMLVDQGYLDPALLQDESGNEQQIVEALYRALVDSPSMLQAASIVDAVGERRAQNQPGTNNEYPNWRIPLADGQGNVVTLESLFDHPRLQSLAAVMRGR